MIYFDNNATTAMSAKSFLAMNELENLPYNASSVHGFGRKARKLIEDARKTILNAVGISNFAEYNVIFTSSGSESNNLALLGLQNHFKNGHVIIGAKTEHPSIANILREKSNVKFIEVFESGEIDIKSLEEQLKQTKEDKLVTVMLANNETGVMQDFTKIVKICKEHNALIHTDAVQAFGKIPVDFEELGVDMMSIAAHKCGGPVGASCLIVRDKITISSIIQGGKQEKGARAGTENVRAIVGFAAAASENKERIEKMKAIEPLRNMMESRILDNSEGTKIYGKDAQRIPNTSCIAMKGMNNETQLMHFDIYNIAISAGSACSSGKIKISHVLKAMKADEEEAKCAIRVSLGVDSTEEETKKFIDKWLEIYQKID